MFIFDKMNKLNNVNINVKFGDVYNVMNRIIDIKRLYEDFLNRTITETRNETITRYIELAAVRLLLNEQEIKDIINEKDLNELIADIEAERDILSNYFEPKRDAKSGKSSSVDFTKFNNMFNMFNGIDKPKAEK